MKRKIFSVLFALVLVLSFSLIPAVPVAAAYEPTIGWWQPTEPPDSGTAEYSKVQAYSADYSVHLEAFEAYSPADYHEVYVANPTGVSLLDDLTDVSFWYYCPSGENTVAPLIDVWLDLDGTYSRDFPPTGDDEWLLGMLADVTTFNTWVPIIADDIEWVRATGGMVYGTGTVGLDNAKIELGDCPVLAIGVETGGPGTYISSRLHDMDFYVDDITINDVTYTLEPDSDVDVIVDIPSMVAISVTPTSIDFGTLNPGDSSEVTTLTVENVGTTTVDVTDWIAPGTVFDNLLVGGEAVGSEANPVTVITDLVGKTSSDVTVQLVVPSAYSAQGVESATLIFEVTPK